MKSKMSPADEGIEALREDNRKARIAEEIERVKATPANQAAKLQAREEQRLITLKLKASEGTPKTLNQAIENAFNSPDFIDEKTHTLRPEVIESHVKDFLGQRFGTLILDSDDNTARALMKLFKEITGKEVSPEFTTEELNSAHGLGIIVQD